MCNGATFKQGTASVSGRTQLLQLSVIAIAEGCYKVCMARGQRPLAGTLTVIGKGKARPLKATNTASCPQWPRLGLPTSGARAPASGLGNFPAVALGGSGLYMVHWWQAQLGAQRQLTRGHVSEWA